MVLNDNARMRSCCFTGHRPEKLHWRATSVITALKAEIEQAITDGFNLFIVGMARGVDIWAAEIVLRLRNAGIPINLVCAIPYEGFELRWSASWQERYRAILHAANQVEFIKTASQYLLMHEMNKDEIINYKELAITDEDSIKNLFNSVLDHITVIDKHITEIVFKNGLTHKLLYK